MEKIALLLVLILTLGLLSSCTLFQKPDPFLDMTYGQDGDKTVRQQREEIADAMERAMNTEVVWREIEEYNPTIEQYAHIKAITYDAFDYQGQKTKVFAFVGFPEGASADSPVPAVVLIHGGGGHPYMDWVRLWNDRGYAAIAMETTGYFPIARNDGVDEGQNHRFVYGMHGIFLEEGYTNAPDRAYTAEYTEVEDQWAYHGLTQVILAHNILRQDERVDKDNIGITGISWGGVMTAQVLGYDNRFSFAVAAYGTAYLGDEMRPFDMFAEPYVDALWAAERTLDDVKTPILWYVYNDDDSFGIPSHVKSYQHTANNDKTVLLMLGNWGHSHWHVLTKTHSFSFANWVTFGKEGFVTFTTQPEGKEISCNISIPEQNDGEVTATLYYITEPMSYSEYDKFNWGFNSLFLDQTWQTNTECLTVDMTNGTVTGIIPADAKGYYIQLAFDIEGEEGLSSSVYVAVE